MMKAEKRDKADGEQQDRHERTRAAPRGASRTNTRETHPAEAHGRASGGGNRRPETPIWLRGTLGTQDVGEGVKGGEARAARGAGRNVRGEAVGFSPAYIVVAQRRERALGDPQRAD
jgi:hypothetical protein